MTAVAPVPVQIIGRYALYRELASGGMATVHIGRLLGPVGFARTVAIKRLHPQFAKDPEFVSMFLDEARLAARIQHPNVCSTLDVVATEGELFLVMEHLQGETLSKMIRATRERGHLIEPRVAVAIMAQALHGLHAAHEAKSERGEPLGIVHRDMSPQNVLIGRDGITKVLDFGVAKAVGRFHTTSEGKVKGKLPYMAPEQLLARPIDRQTDVYAAAVCLWETLAVRKLFTGDNEGALLERVLFGAVDPPSRFASGIPEGLDALVMRGLDRDPAKRFATAREFALALERAVHPALASEVGDWVENVAGPVLSQRAERVAEIESASDSTVGVPELPSDAAIPSLVSGSLVSSISVGENTERTAKRRRALWIGIAACALTSLVIVGVVLAVRSPPTTPRAAGSTHAPDELSHRGPTIETTHAMPPPTTVIEAPSASGTSAVAGGIQPRVKTSRPASSAPAAATSATDDCSVLYTIGPTGEKIWKRHCFK